MMHTSFSTEPPKTYQQATSSTTTLIQLNPLSANQSNKATGCPPSCTCENCTFLGYNKVMFVADEDQIVYGGPVMVRLPVSNLFQMIGQVSLSYKTFHNYSLRDIVKLKATYA